MRLRHRRGSRRSAAWLRRVGALLSGAALSLVFPQANLWWLAFVGLVPVLLFVADAGGWKEAAFRSWLGGVGFFVTLHHWLVPALGPFTVPAGAVMATSWIPVGVVAWMTLVHPRSGRDAAVAAVLVPATWVVVEVARSWDVLGGSWGLLGLSQWRVHAVLALAAIGGVWALSALLLVSNTAVTVALRPSLPARTRAVVLLGGGALVGASIGWGMTRPAPVVEATVRLGGVQPGVVHDPDARLRANERLSRELGGAKVDLVVWGQSSVGFDPRTNEGVRRRLEETARRLGTDVLVNVDARGSDGRISKSAVLVRPDVGLDDTYEKQRLVPFGEYIPLRPVLGWLAEYTDAATEDRRPGGDLTLMRSGDVVFGPLISYESTFPDMRRALARLDPHLTLVQGASTTFQGSWAQPQQASYEAVRAVESGRPAVLVAVSGTSSAFDARGRQLAWVPSDVRGTWTVEVPLSRERTPYVRVGDWVPVLSLLALTVGAAGAGWRRWGPSRSVRRGLG